MLNLIPDSEPEHWRSLAHLSRVPRSQQPAFRRRARTTTIPETERVRQLILWARTDAATPTNEEVSLCIEHRRQGKKKIELYELSNPSVELLARGCELVATMLLVPVLRFSCFLYEWSELCHSSGNSIRVPSTLWQSSQSWLTCVLRGVTCNANLRHGLPRNPRECLVPILNVSCSATPPLIEFSLSLSTATPPPTPNPPKMNYFTFFQGTLKHHHLWWRTQ